MVGIPCVYSREGAKHELFGPGKGSFLEVLPQASPREVYGYLGRVKWGGITYRVILGGGDGGNVR